MPSLLTFARERFCLHKFVVSILGNNDCLKDRCAHRGHGRIKVRKDVGNKKDCISEAVGMQGRKECEKFLVVVASF